MWLEQAIVELAMARRGKRQAKRYLESRIHLERYTTVRDLKVGGMLLVEGPDKVRRLPPTSWEKAYQQAAKMLAGTSMAGNASTMKASYGRVRRDLNTKRFGKYFTLKDWRYRNNGRSDPKGPSKLPSGQLG
jgi:hypothetical protein